MSSRLRPRTPQEIREAAQPLLVNLTRALDAFDAGNEYELRTVAAATRTTVGLGKGDRVVLRLVNAFRLVEPIVYVPAIGELWSQIDTQIGPIPCEQDRAESRPVPLGDWLEKETAALLPELGRLTWDKFINFYANDLSTHISESVRSDLEAVRLFQGPAQSLADYMMRAAGAQAERALSDVLSQLGDATATERPLFTGGVEIGAVTRSKNSEIGWSSSVHIHADAHVAEIPVGPRAVTVDWVWRAETGTGDIVINQLDALDPSPDPDGSAG